MITNTGLMHLLRCGCRRQLSTSQMACFKFKLTEEMMRESADAQTKAVKKEPEKSLHAREGSLIMARVSHERHKNIIKCAVPKHRLNDLLLMYVRENDNVQALDDNGVANPGDWILLRRDESIPDKNVDHRVEKIVYTYGKYVDPITNRRSLGLYFDDDWEQLERIKIDI